MSSLHPVNKILQASPTSSEHTSDIIGGIWSQDAAGTQSLTTGSEFDLTETSNFEYSHLQSFNQAEVERTLSDSPDASPPPASVVIQHATRSPGISSSISREAIDLSISTSNDDNNLVMSGEKTPVFCNEVPSSVLARVKGEESPVKATSKNGEFSKNQSISAARVCLEKRFNSMCADTTRQPEKYSAVLSNCLTVFQPSAEAQEAFTLPQTQMLKADRANPLKVSSSHVGGLFDPMTNLFGQVIAHVAEPNICQGLIMPPSFSFNFYPETSVIKTVYADSSSLKEEQQLAFTKMDVMPDAVYNSLCPEPTKAGKTASKPPQRARKGGCKRARSCLPLTQRKERHNRVERERRRMIRSFCDELNTMVPFCDSKTDKATTLKWTTAFLRYIKHMHGDRFKEEFQLTTVNEREHLKSNPSSGQQLSCPKTDKALSTSLGTEQ